LTTLQSQSYIVGVENCAAIYIGSESRSKENTVTSDQTTIYKKKLSLLIRVIANSQDSTIFS